MLYHRAQREGGHIVQQAHQQHHARQQRHKQRARVGKVPSVAVARFLAARDPAMASTGTITPKRPSHMATASSTL